jgi:D-3-phosphoglycerate dehydrogenase
VSHVVAVLDHRFPDLSIEADILAELGEVELRDGAGLDRDAAIELARDADAVLVGARLRLDADALDAIPNCKVVVRYGVGFENIDIVAATARGIRVAYVPDYCVDEVADHTIALMLALHRRLFEFDAAVREGAWGIPPGIEIKRLSECTLGIVGFGRIGEAVGRRAAALRMRVLAVDPARPAEDVAAAGATLVSLDDALPELDFLTLHAPYLPGSAILDADRIAALPARACVINVARGGLIDEVALADALERGTLRGAGLDVAAAEPLLPPNRLLDAPNVIVTPHAAWYSLEAVRELRAKTASEAARVLRGDAPLHPANLTSTAAADVR